MDSILCSLSFIGHHCSGRSVEVGVDPEHFPTRHPPKQSLLWKGIKKVSCMQLAIQVLRFINELICVDLRSFGAIAEQAGLPLILQYATGEASFKGDYALDVRLQAAYLVQTLAQGTLAMSQLLTASRVTPCPPLLTHFAFG